MAISDLTPDITRGPAPAVKRTSAATEAKMRKSEERWADHLRGRGWSVVHPTVVSGLLEHAPEHGPGDDCRWCEGYRQALLDVLGNALPVVDAGA